MYVKGHLAILRDAWRKGTPRSTGSLLAGVQGKADVQLVRTTLVKTLNCFHTRHLTAAPTLPLHPVSLFQEAWASRWGPHLAWWTAFQLQLGQFSFRWANAYAALVGKHLTISSGAGTLGCRFGLLLKRDAEFSATGY